MSDDIEGVCVPRAVATKVSTAGRFSLVGKRDLSGGVALVSKDTPGNPIACAIAAQQTRVQNVWPRNCTNALRRADLLQVRASKSDEDQQHTAFSCARPVFHESGQFLSLGMAEGEIRRQCGASSGSPSRSGTGRPRCAGSAMRRALTRCLAHIVRGAAVRRLGVACVLAFATTVTGPVEGQARPAAGAPSVITQPLPVRQELALEPRLAGRAGISGVVRIAPDLVNRIEATDTLFVYARALDGDPAPLVVLRKRAHELPVAFFLDDSIAINKARLPSRHNELVIGARVARRGSAAAPATGDLQGFSGPVRYGQAGVVIVIDSEVK